MAVTLNEIASDIRNTATSGDLTYSFRIEDEQIYYWIHQTRAMLISQAIAKRQDITDNWIQIIKCLEMEEVDASECCLDITNCKILRSVQQLPVTIETAADNSIIRVTTSTGDIISKSNPFEAKYVEYNKWTSKKPQWFIQNNYLYITNFSLVKYVNVYGLFEDPSALAAFNSCDGSSCFDIDNPYPVTNKMANEIAAYIMKAKVVPFMSFKQDDTNDGNNESAQLQGKP